ncbi:MAG: Crp/Fnr family transcriptional regulator [Flavobacteriales bacterium]
MYDLNHIKKLITALIPIDILTKYNADLIVLKKNEFLFNASSIPRFYFQIQEGEVKVFNTNKDGKEYIHSIFSKDRGIGEVALLGEFNYPTSCSATKNSKIWRLAKKDFVKLLKTNPEIHFEISKAISKRMYFKAVISTEISIENPEHRILTLIDYLKYTIYNIGKPFDYKVELSRQQIADLIGLRVETVIRTIKKLEAKKKIKLKNSKIYR